MLCKVKCQHRKEQFPFLGDENWLGGRCAVREPSKRRWYLTRNRAFKEMDCLNRDGGFADLCHLPSLPSLVWIIKNLKKPWRGWWWKQALQKSGLTQQGRAFKASPDPQSLRQTRLLLILSSSSHSYCKTDAENEKFQWAKTCKRERKTWKFPPIIPSLKEPGYIYLSNTSHCVDSIGELFKCHAEVLNIAV